ncbi:MAG TPA: hypothetical protein DEB07_03495 [Candidatus Moranbacteria bacterium]|nr:hypothetical protein [Candidatus Moranbacteria bacterium]HBU25273.1 hypothetical protein [Candidatus Moranbacteria bacterium]
MKGVFHFLRFGLKNGVRVVLGRIFRKNLCIYAMLAILVAAASLFTAAKFELVNGNIFYSGGQVAGETKAIAGQNLKERKDLAERLKDLPRVEVEKKEIFSAREARPLSAGKGDISGEKDGRYDFKSNENASFKIALPKGGAQKKSSLIDKTLRIQPARAAGSQVIAATLADPTGKALEDADIFIDESDEKATITVEKPEREFRPGKYELKVEIVSENQAQVLTTTQDFTWGVLAINLNKSIYAPEETARLQFGVLDEKGNMVCDASLKLEIRNEKEEIYYELSTEAGTIKVNADTCQSKAFTLIPDFEAEYKTGGEGKYEMTLTAETANGTHAIKDSFEVRNFVPFDVERTSTTRIFPKNEYPVVFNITANQDFRGKILEEVPKDFEVREFDLQNSGIQNLFEIRNSKFEIQEENGKKQLVWDVDVKKGEQFSLGYQYDAPDISPEFYLLGPLVFKSKIRNPKSEINSNDPNTNIQNNGIVFQEFRQWQIAADAIAYVNASTPETDAGGAFTVTGMAPAAAGNIIILQVIQDGTTDGAVTFASATNIENLAGTDNQWTAITEQTAGASDEARQYLWIGRSLSTSAPTFTGGNSTSQDVFFRMYQFSGVSTGTTLASVLENGTAGTVVNGSATSSSVLDTGVTTAGNGRLALNFIGFNDEVPAAQLTAMAGETGGDWTYPVAAYGSASGTDGGVALVTAVMASAGTINGGSDAITSYAWGVIGFALIPYVPPPVVVSGTSGMRTGDTVKVSINGGAPHANTGTIDAGTGSWTISVPVTDIASGNSVIVWTDTATAGNQSTAISKWDGSGDMTGMVLDANVLSIGSANSSGVTSAETDDFTCASSGGGNVMHAFASSTLSVEGCSKTYTSEKIDILAGNTLTISGTETLTTYDLTITGTLTSGGASTYNVSHNWVHNGTAFTASTSTVNLNGGTAQTINGSTSTTFNNLNISNSSAAISASTNFSTGGTLTVGAGAILTPAAAVVMNGSGTLTGSGTVQVTRTSATASFGVQYTITNKTLTNLTVEYTGTGQVLTDLTYGNLTISSNAIATGTNTATVGGIFTVGASGVFTPSGGTMTFNNGSSISNSGSLTFQALTIAASATVTASTNFNAAGTFTINGSATFAPDAAVVLNSAGVAGTITGTGTVRVTRTAATPDYSSQYKFTTNTLSGLTVDYYSASAQTISAVNYGNLASSNSGARTLASSGTVGISGTFTIGGSSYTITGSTVEYNGAGQTVGAINYNNLTLSGSGTKTLQTGTTSIAGNFTLSETASTTAVFALVVGGALNVSGGSLTTAGYLLVVAGTTTVNGGTLTLDNDTGVKRFSGAVSVSSGTLNGASTNIEIRNGITQSSTGTVAITGTATFTITAAQALAGTQSIATISVATGVTLTNNGAATVSTALSGLGAFANGAAGTLSFGAADAPTVATFTMDTSGNTMSYNNASAGQAMRAATYHNLTIDKTAQTATLGGTTTVNGDLTVTSGILAGTDNLTVKGEVTGAGTITLTGSSTFTHQIGGAKSFGSSGGSADWTFNNLNFENSSGGDLAVTTRSGGSGKVFVVSGTLTVGNAGNSNKTTLSNNSNNRVMDVGSVNITSKGELVASGSAAFTVSGSWLNSGTFTASGGTMTFDDTAGGKTLSGTMVSPSAFAAVTFNGSGGGWSVNSALSATGDFNLTNGQLTQGADIDMTFLGNVTLSSGTTFINASGAGKFIMDGDAENETFTDATSPQQNLGAVQIGLSPGTTNMSSNMTATSLTINVGDRLNTKGYDITLTDYLTCNGTLDAQNATAGNATIITVGGNWTMSSTTGTFTVDNGPTYYTSVIFNAGSTGKTIDAGGASRAFTDIQFNNGSGGWTIQTNDMKVLRNLDITNIADSADSWTLGSGRTLEVDGTYTITAAETAYTKWTGSTFYLNGTSQTIGAKTQPKEEYATLQIGANTDIRMWNSSALTYTVDSSGSLYSQDHNYSDGSVYIWGDYHVNATDYWSYATDFDNTDISGTPRRTEVRIDPAANITVDSGDTLASIGTVSSGMTIVDRQGTSGGYGITVASGGTINFEYTDFENLEGPNGLYIQSTGVTSLDHCKFNNLVDSGATDAFIRVDASVMTSNKTWDGVQFDNSSSGANYNVYRTGTGTANYWSFTNYTGLFDGAANEYEADASDMIQWASTIDSATGRETIEGSVNFEGSFNLY